MGTYYHAFAVSKDRSRIASPVFQTHRTYVLSCNGQSVFDKEERLTEDDIRKLVELAKKDGRDGCNVCCLPRILDEGQYYGGYVPPFHVMTVSKFLELVREAERVFLENDEDPTPFEPDDMTVWLGSHTDLDVVVYPEVN